MFLLFTYPLWLTLVGDGRRLKEEPVQALFPTGGEGDSGYAGFILTVP